MGQREPVSVYHDWTFFVWEYSGGPFDGLASSSSEAVPDEIRPDDYEGSYMLDPSRKGTNGVAMLVWQPA